MLKILLRPGEEEIRDYCLNHPLTRPDVSYNKVLLHFLLIEVCLISVSFLLSLMFGRLFVLLLIVHGIYYLLLSRRFLALCVQLYQHYASEETRRRCICKPSCSEYAISVLQKHYTLKAICLIIKRLFFTCSGYHYVEDEP